MKDENQKNEQVVHILFIFLSPIELKNYALLLQDHYAKITEISPKCVNISKLKENKTLGDTLADHRTLHTQSSTSFI